MTPCGTHILFVPPKRQSKQEKCKKLRKLKENSGGGGGEFKSWLSVLYLQVPNLKVVLIFRKPQTCFLKTSSCRIRDIGNSLSIQSFQKYWPKLVSFILALKLSWQVVSCSSEEIHYTMIWGWLFLKLKSGSSNELYKTLNPELV